MSVHEQKPKEKKDHPILHGVAIATIMLFVTTIYNLFLAHIWPVTIHFGDYSFANAIYIMVSVLTSLVIAYITFYLGAFYFLYAIFSGFLWFLSTPEQRAASKRSWLVRTINGLGFFFMLPFYVVGKWQERKKPPVESKLPQPIWGDIWKKFPQTQSKNEENQQP